MDRRNDTDEELGLTSLGEQFVASTQGEDAAEAERQFQAERARKQADCEHRIVLENETNQQRICADCDLWLTPKPLSLEERVANLEAQVAALLARPQFDYRMLDR